MQRSVVIYHDGISHLSLVFSWYTHSLKVCIPWKSKKTRGNVAAGAIIGDGDRKSWDPRAPMIWDNFSIFRTNCAILTSYIRADPRTCRGLSRGCCHVAWSNGEWRYSLADFSAQRWQGIKQGIRTRAPICSFMLWDNGKGEFFRVENKTSISRCEWIICARGSCTSKILRLFCEEKLCKKTFYSGIELICEFPKQCLILLFLFVWRVCKSFLKASLRPTSSSYAWCSACTFKSEVGVFNCQQILTKISFVVFCAEMLQQFSATPKGW